MGGFTFRIRVYILEYNMTEICFPFFLQSIQLQKLFVQPDILLRKRKWSTEQERRPGLELSVGLSHPLWGKQVLA